jgi:hypothetical protein
METLSIHLDKLNSELTTVIVFVHGWKHNGQSSDENLKKFEERVAKVAAEPGASWVLGVFVAWRGLSLYGLGLENLTFWDRKQAGLRVSMGAPRELFGRLRQFRAKGLKAGGVPVLIIIGHSFGGMIVYSALAQSLIEAAATQTGEIIPSFADLVLLVNPAFEAIRYLPIHDLIRERSAGSFAEHQLPVFVSVTGRNDQATGILFPLGMWITRLQEDTRGPEERQALIYTMGHLPWMKTHTLSASRLTLEQFDKKNPFWVVSATKDMINGHNGIWGKHFVDFVHDLILKQLRVRSVASGAGSPA